MVKFRTGFFLAYMDMGAEKPAQAIPGRFRIRASGKHGLWKLQHIYPFFVLTQKPKPMKPQSLKERISVDKGIHRNAMLEMGMYNIHKEKAYKDKSKYTRKDKHRKPPKDE